jgi:hypothetical protein
MPPIAADIEGNHWIAAPEPPTERNTLRPETTRAHGWQARSL